MSGNMERLTYQDEVGLIPERPGWYDMHKSVKAIIYQIQEISKCQQDNLDSAEKVMDRIHPLWDESIHKGEQQGNPHLWQTSEN